MVALPLLLPIFITYYLLSMINRYGVRKWMENVEGTTEEKREDLGLCAEYLFCIVSSTYTRITIIKKM